MRCFPYARFALAGTEQHIGENGLGGVVPDKTDPYMRTDLPVWNFTAALGLAKGINQGYLTANQTAVLIWTPTCKCLPNHKCLTPASSIMRTQWVVALCGQSE